jgi:hypothetical protein
VAEQGRTWRRSEWAELERRDASGARWWRWSCSTRCATSGGGGGRDAADLDMANLTVSVMRKGVSAGCIWQRFRPIQQEKPAELCRKRIGWKCLVDVHCLFVDVHMSM